MDNKLKTVDAETLLSTPMSKTMFIVDGLISQGVNVISGASKIGKSWLMLWLGLQAAQGNSIWGLPTLQCDVLYLSLEDTQRRIKDRLYNLTDSAPDNLYFAVTSGLIGGGLEEQITDFLTEHPATKLVIIDTLQKVRDSKGSAGKAGVYGNDYDDISSIKRIADGFNIAILLVHHLRKLQDSDDPFNDVSGSTGIIGAADTNFILRRKRSGNAATLLVSGRDMEYQELTLQFKRPCLGTGGAQEQRGYSQGGAAEISVSGGGLYGMPHRMGGHGYGAAGRNEGAGGHAQYGHEVSRSVRFRGAGAAGHRVSHQANGKKLTHQISAP